MAREISLTPQEIVDEWLSAFNRGDADGMVALYSDDAIHTSPKLRAAHPAGEGRVVGKAAMRRWWQDAFDRSPGTSWSPRYPTIMSPPSSTFG
jgi:ketosteroid isomerase-like protein